MCDTVDIDPDGDLILVIGHEQRRFRVSRVAMRLASPVWKALVAGRFAEASAAEISFAEDNPKTMETLLLLAHLQFKRLPEKPSMAHIAAVAKYCDRYDTTLMARDYIDAWLAKHDPNTKNETYVQNFLRDNYSGRVTLSRQCLWIGWAFKKHSWFKDAMHGLLVNSSYVKIAEQPELPPGCKNFILHHMTQQLNVILDMVYDMLHKASSHDPVCLHLNKHWRQHCAMIRLGLITTLMNQMGLSRDSILRPEPEMINFSLGSMAKVCDQMYLPHHHGHLANHGPCFTDFDNLRRHLKATRALDVDDDLRADFATFLATEEL